MPTYILTQRFVLTGVDNAPEQWKKTATVLPTQLCPNEIRKSPRLWTCTTKLYRTHLRPVQTNVTTCLIKYCISIGPRGKLKVFSEQCLTCVFPLN